MNEAPRIITPRAKRIITRAPHLWTRRPRILEPKDELQLKPRVAGYFKLDVRRPDGRVRTSTGWFPNIITDVGLDYIGTSQAWVNTCVVGTGNSTPDVGDTALDAQIASTGNRVAVTGANNQTADRYMYARTTYRFAAGAAAGNLAEIGIVASGTFPLFSRALILDGSGDPSTITILSDEVLDATYEVRTYPPLTDLNTSMEISATPYDIVLRAAEVDQWGMIGGGFSQPTGWSAGHATKGATIFQSTSTLGTVLTSPSGSGAGNTSATTSAYSAGSLFRDFAYTWGIGAAPSGGAGACDFWCGGLLSGGGEATGAMKFQMSFDPVVPKDGTNNLVLNWRMSWTRRSI